MAEISKNSKILYSVTVNINNDVHDEWLYWMQNVHMPEVMQTGMFIENRMCRLIGDEDSGGVTYSMQYVCANIDKYYEYQDKFAPNLQAETLKKFKDKFVAFRTLLEII